MLFRSLNNIEDKRGIMLLRQYRVNKYFLDGYDPVSNVAYEVDEVYHSKRRVEDIIREQSIRSKINCDFIRIQD